jgi:Protein of unknown function (DUF2950)
VITARSGRQPIVVILRGIDRKIYVPDGRMREGFTWIAWPAIYGASGIMPFEVNQDGVLFQKISDRPRPRSGQNRPGGAQGGGGIAKRQPA